MGRGRLGALAENFNVVIVTGFPIDERIFCQIAVGVDVAFSGLFSPYTVMQV